jgi:hypothetical protein
MAFQSNAFQNSAFQVDVVVANPGSRIASGHWSKGKWRELRDELEAERQAKALAARRKREAARAEAKRIEDARLAKIAEAERQKAERLARYEADLAADLAAIPPIDPSATTDQIALAISQMRFNDKRARQMDEEAKRQAALEEEEAAAALLLM